MTFRIISSDAIPEDAALVYAGAPSMAGVLEIQQRADAGEDFGTVYCEVMVRERKAFKITFSATMER